jgi:hypothetical protein
MLHSRLVLFDSGQRHGTLAGLCNAYLGRVPHAHQIIASLQSLVSNKNNEKNKHKNTLIA